MKHEISQLTLPVEICLLCELLLSPPPPPIFLSGNACKVEFQNEQCL